MNNIMKLFNLFNNNKALMKQVFNYINNKQTIRINEFKEYFGFLDVNRVIEILDVLCDLNILKKTERMYICSNCKQMLGVLSKWDEGDDITCNNCGVIHPHADICDTDTVYSLYTAPTLKMFNVSWLDKYEKDSNGNPLPRRADVIVYSQADAESLVHEYYHYIKDSIQVSSGITLKNKMLIKEYN